LKRKIYRVIYESKNGKDLNDRLLKIGMIPGMKVIEDTYK
jgi:Fe2+ transport system protein FeoA